MVHSQAVTCRTILMHDTAITVTCPKCKTCSKVLRTSIPHIDTCGFESYSFRCDRCESTLGGVNPLDGKLLVSLFEPAIDLSAMPTRGSMF
jgi:hypothetical protein